MRYKGLRLTTYPQIMSRLAIRGAISLFAPYTFMKWTLRVLAFGFHLALRWLSCNLMECIALRTAQTRKKTLYFQSNTTYISFSDTLGDSLYPPMKYVLCFTEIWEFLGAFAKSRKESISVVVSAVRPPARMTQLGSHWTDFHEVWFLSIFRKKKM